MDVFSWLPIGYMIVSPTNSIPSNFIEVDGQRLSKMEYQDVYDILQGNVRDDGDTFVLPKRQDLSKLFNDATSKIILKLR